MRHMTIIAVAFFTLLPASLSAQESDLKKLIKDISDDDTDVCLRAVDSLSDFGTDAEGAVPELVKALQREDPEICWHVCRTLGAIGESAKAAVPGLTKLLKDKDPKVRGYAAFALGRIGKPALPAADALIANAFDEEPLVRRATLRALQAIDPPQEKTLPVVIKILEQGDMSVIIPALRSLAAEGKEAVPRLRKALKHKEAQYWACVVLADIGPDAAPAVGDIRDVLKSEDPDTRLQALVALGDIGKASRVAIPTILAVAEGDKFEHVRYAAVYALGRIGANDAAEAKLHIWMKSEDPFLRVVSAWALGRNNLDDKGIVESTVKLIVDSFKSDDVDVRRAAARAMVELDADPQLVGPLLVEALNDKDDTVVANAIAALAAFGPKALDHVDDALADKELRHYALLLLARIGADAASAVPALVSALKQANDNPEDIEFTREAHFALSQIGPAGKMAIPQLIKALGSEHDEVSASASYALGKMGPAARASIPALQRAASSKSLLVRAASVFALWQIQPGNRTRRIRARVLLLKALDEDRALVRAGAATMLGELGSKDDEVTTRLIGLRDNDEVELVQRAAAEALKKLEG